jgi:hypothetical protein
MIEVLETNLNNSILPNKNSKVPPFKRVKNAFLTNFTLTECQNIVPFFLIILIVSIGMVNVSCGELTTTQNKSSSALLLQIALRKQQLASPTQERLNQMQSMGMQTGNISMQRIYIYLAQQLTAGQQNELASIGITIYANSWIPPVANHPNGFILADMPVDKLDALIAKNYVISLDTAETRSEPQSLNPS